MSGDPQDCVRTVCLPCYLEPKKGGPINPQLRGWWHPLRLSTNEQNVGMKKKNKQIHRNRCQWLLLDHVLEQTIRFQCKFIYFFSNMLALFLRMRKKTTRALACVVCRWANQRGVTLQLKTHYRVATFFFSVIVVVDLSLRNRRKKHAKEH